MLIDVLESRTLFSSVAVPALPKDAGPKTKADYAADVAASSALNSAKKADTAAAKGYAKAAATLLKKPTSIIIADEAALKSDKITITAKVKADIQTTAAEAKALVTAFEAGNQTDVTADLLVLKSDYAQIKTDTDDKISALAADAAKLASDTNADPTVAPLFSTVQTDTSTLTADQAATFTTDLAAYKADLKEKPLP
jgi:hypothetical protein